MKTLQVNLMLKHILNLIKFYIHNNYHEYLLFMLLKSVSVKPTVKLEIKFFLNMNSN